MSQHSILPDGCKSSNFERGLPWQCPPITFVPTKSSAPEGLPVKIKISKDLSVIYHTFHGGTGEQYSELLEDFESIVHRKGLCELYENCTTNRNAHQAELDLHLSTKTF